jgi:hypothetical protein
MPLQTLCAFAPVSECIRVFRVFRVFRGSIAFLLVWICARFNAAFQVSPFPVKYFEKYFLGRYCVTIREYSALRRHYSLPSLRHVYFAELASEICAIMRLFTCREDSNFPCAPFFDMTQNALMNPAKTGLCGTSRLKLPERVFKTITPYLWCAPVPGRSNSRTADRVKEPGTVRHKSFAVALTPHFECWRLNVQG